VPRDGLCILGGRGVYFRGAVSRLDRPVDAGG
jgi:hypothetical protein